jgi:integrase
MNMLNAPPRHPTIFQVNQDMIRKCFQRQRKATTQKLQNPRIMQISFHTLRHFKATMEYHKTRDILHVMQILGHRSITNTLKYTQLINFKDDEFTAKVAHTEQELCQLLEAGYEYVCDYNQDKILRKHK